MKIRSVYRLPRGRNNARNSEGTFLYTASGALLFAYSRFSAGNGGDGEPSDIGLLASYDDGETWEDRGVAVPASFFGVDNIMSCSFLRQKDGKTGLYFLIKENDGTSSYGRALTGDGRVFTPERVKFIDLPKGYYIVNNDRLIRDGEGRILCPVAHCIGGMHCASTCLYSEDDGATFRTYHAWADISLPHSSTGLQEPGAFLLPDGTVWMYARTDAGFQYESFSYDGLRSFTAPVPSVFTSPASPMLIKKGESGAVYALYNPIPNYNGRRTGGITGRTPIVIRKSTDGGLTFGPCRVIGGDENRAYCYPACLETKDGGLVVSFCQGRHDTDSGMDAYGLYETGIYKLNPDEL